MKNIKRNSFLILFFSFFYFTFVSGQEEIDPASRILPPSPTASAIAKYQDLAVGLHTGTPSLSIPIHTLQGDGIDVPISISYHGGGVKVDEVSSWVGIDWSLLAGGIISRTVMGQPDEGPNGFRDIDGLPYPFQYTAEVLDLIYNVGSDFHAIPYDSQPDMFSFNFGEYSGKFVFDENGNIRTIPHQNIQISVPSNFLNDLFEVTTPDGMIYRFGGPGAVDRSGSQITWAEMPEASYQFQYIDFVATSWHLIEIHNPNTEETIYFNYTPHHINYEMAYSETHSTPIDIEFNESNDPHLHFCDNNSYNFSRSIVSKFEEGYHLSSITSSFGSVEFICAGNREDLIVHTGNGREVNRLNQVIVKGMQGNILKTFDFTQGFWTSTQNNISNNQPSRKRMYLKSITERGHDGTTLPPYEFSYLNGDKLPPRLSFNQDHWGYYNGPANSYSNYFTPYLEDLNVNYQLNLTGANREVNHDYSNFGTLSKIIYPTGAVKKVFYEGNSVPVCSDEPYWEKTSETILADWSNPHNSPPQPYSVETSIYLDIPQDVTVDYKVVMTSVYGAELSIVPTDAGNSHPGLFWGGYDTQAPITLEGIAIEELPAGNYKITARVENGPALPDYPYGESAFAKIIYLERHDDLVINQPIGGIRVSRLETNDNNENVSIKKIDYSQVEANCDNLSSGVTMGRPPLYFSKSRQIAYQSIPPVSCLELYECDSKVAKSSSYLQLNSNIGNVVNYEEVTEIYGENGENGKIHHLFLITPDKKPPIPDGYFHPDFGNEIEAILSTPWTDMSWKSGLLLEQKVYNSNDILLKKTKNTYHFDEHHKYNIKAANIAKIFDHPCENSYLYTTSSNGDIIPIFRAIEQYAIHYYDVLSQWFYLDSSTTTEYNEQGENPLISSNSYQYSPEHLNLIVATATAPGVSQTTNISYAHDVLSNYPLKNEMIARGMTGVPLITLVTGSITSGNKTEYKMVGNKILPEKIYQVEGSSGLNLIGTFSYIDNDHYPDSYQKEDYDYPEIYSWYPSGSPKEGLLQSKQYISWTWIFDYFEDSRLLQTSGNIDGTSISYTYDDLQRLKTQTVNGLLGTKSVTTNTYTIGGANQIATTTTFPDGTPTQKSIQSFDGLGRLISNSINGVTRESYVYDEFQRVAEKSILPSGTSSFEYEPSPLNRTIKETFSDGSFTEMHYDAEEGFYKQIFTDENVHISYTLVDGFGRTVRNVDPLGGITNYEFDNFGNISIVTTPLGRVYSYNYDSNNRLKDKTIPGEGEYSYTYYDNDLMRTQRRPNGHIEYLYYDDYDRLETVSLDGETSSANDIIQNFYDFNNGDQFSAYFGKMSSQNVRVLGTDDWLVTEYAYDGFGRIINESADNYIGGSNISNFSYNNADNLTSNSLLHSTTYGDDVIVKTVNEYDNRLRLNLTRHQVNDNPMFKLSQLYYNDGDQIIKKLLFGEDENNSLLQNIKYGYNSRGWLTNINQISEGFDDENIPECVLTPTCDKCDYTAYVTFDRGRQIIGIYANGGELVDLPAYPYALYEMAQMEIDLENWLNQNGILHSGVNITIEGGAYITISQSAIPFNTVVLSDKTVIAFDETNCTGPSTTSSEICDLCNRNGYNCNDCPYWNLQDECTTCQELGIINCTNCAFDNAPCTRCTNLGYSDCSTCPLSLDAIKPIKVTIDYNYAELSSGTKASLIKVNEKSKYFDHNQAFKIVEKQSTQIVGTDSISNHTPTHTMEIDMYNYWINANTSLAVLDSLEVLLIAELNTAGITSAQVQNDFVDAVEQSLSLSWKNTTSITPEPEYDINNPDLFAMEISYGTGDDYTESPGQFNGNISGLTWKVAGKAVQNYSFWYDPLDRLNQGLYKDVQTGLASLDNKYGVEMDYDLEGNIKWLTRRGVTEICEEGLNLFSYDYDQIDNLVYTYNTENRLGNITENSNQAFGYKGAGGDFEYDAAGNLKVDQNKKMTIVYNYLNLPLIITFMETGSTIRFTYDALGNKLQKVVNGVVRQEYVDGIEYNEGSIEAIYHQEGRATYDGPKLNYEYFLKDHLGNTRVVFADLNKDGYLQPFNEGGGSFPVSVDYTEILQENHYYPFGMTMDGPWQETVNEPENRYLFNGMEHCDDLDLNWDMAFFRSYDPAIGRWMQVDPKYTYSQSVYSGMGNNPILYSDMLGDTVKFAGAAEQAAYNDYKKIVDGKVAAYDNKTQRIKDKGGLFSKWRVNRREKKRDGNAYVQIQGELNDLESAPDIFRIRMGANISSSSGGGNISFNNTTNEIDINIGTSGPWTQRQRIAHELLHGYQYLNQELDLKRDGHAGIFYDQTDEYAAFRRQNMFSTNTTNQVSDVVGFVSSSISYRHLSTKSLTLSNYKNAAVYKREISAQNAAGYIPRFMTGGWRKF